MEYIYAPWRSEYFSEKKEGCVFCSISQNPSLDEKQGVFYRDKNCFMVMNRYPYTPGHFMIIPHAHIDSPLGLDDEVWIEMSLLCKKSVEILERFGANGVNTGINIKQVAGAGIPDHLHIHMVPRFRGDTNFITSISDTRVYGVDFESVYQKIKTITKEVLD
ncbi:MAG: HIT family protein [Campylobacterales bacterium]